MSDRRYRQVVGVDLWNRWPLLSLVLLLAGLLLVGCGASAQEDEPRSVFIRTPRPTFTVAPPSATQNNPAAGLAEGVSTPEALSSANSGGRGGGMLAGDPRVVVNSPLVNVRSGPGIDFEIVAMVERGEEYAVIGKSGDSTWWNICCVEGASVWVIDEFVDSEGPVDTAPVTEGQPAITEADFLAAPPPAPVQPAVVQPAPPPAAPTLAPTQPPVVAVAPTAKPLAQIPPSLDLFSLVDQEQFPESSMVRIFLYVFGDNSALPGYSLRVRKDGVLLP
ncbi:MAG: hypothetical protein HC802_22645, partial [Caldilineaceae bacterium]|nr:hypothetical protein [Caldilineaceae bacterium]